MREAVGDEFGYRDAPTSQKKNVTEKCANPFYSIRMIT